MTSTRVYQAEKPFHVGIIMDGNGRWGSIRGLPREAGHHAGAAALREIVRAAPDYGITTLTVFAFSTENWRRPESEVATMMDILRRYLRSELAHLVATNVRLTVIGRRDRLADDIGALIVHAERVTREGRGLHLRLAVDYSGRDAILAAIANADTALCTREAMSDQLRALSGGGDVDLVIRTSGEQRLSDFMLWETAFAELYFTKTLWPDFDRAALEDALAAFQSRERRFGGIPAHPPAEPVSLISPAHRRRSLITRLMTRLTGRRSIGCNSAAYCARVASYFNLSRPSAPTALPPARSSVGWAPAHALAPEGSTNHESRHPLHLASRSQDRALSAPEGARAGDT